jgi:hypothetical protein
VRGAPASAITDPLIPSICIAGCPFVGKVGAHVNAPAARIPIGLGLAIRRDLGRIRQFDEKLGQKTALPVSALHEMTAAAPVRMESLEAK